MTKQGTSHFRTELPNSVTIEGAFNLRDFGGHPTNTPGNWYTRKGLLYRSSRLKDVSPSGWKTIKEDLQIETIFDLRSLDEIENAKSSTPSHNTYPHVRVIHSPLGGEDRAHERLARYSQNGAMAADTIPRTYIDLLLQGVNTVKRIIHHIRDHPHQATLVHCTLGKDRTGIIFALLLSLAGVPDDVIASDYHKTEIELEAIRGYMQQSLTREYPDILNPQDYISGLINCEAGIMLTTLHLLRSELGGVEQYLEQFCGITAGDLEFVRGILLVKEDCRL